MLNIVSGFFVQIGGIEHQFVCLVGCLAKCCRWSLWMLVFPFLYVFDRFLWTTVHPRRKAVLYFLIPVTCSLIRTINSFINYCNLLKSKCFYIPLFLDLPAQTHGMDLQGIRSPMLHRQASPFSLPKATFPRPTK